MKPFHVYRCDACGHAESNEGQVVILCDRTPECGPKRRLQVKPDRFARLVNAARRRGYRVRAIRWWLG